MRGFEAADAVDMEASEIGAFIRVLLRLDIIPPSLGVWSSEPILCGSYSRRLHRVLCSSFSNK